MLKRKHSSSSLDNSDQGDDVSISSSVLSKEKEELKNLFCNYIDRLSRKFKVSKNPKCLTEFSNTLRDIKQLSKNDKKGSVKRPIHLRETDSSDEECSAPPKNNLKNFFEERISKICDVQEKPNDYESNPSDLSEFDKNKSESARMILKEKLSNKKRQDLVKKWKDKHFEKTSDNLSMNELQTEKMNLEILTDPKRNSRTSSTSSMMSLTESRNISKPVDDRNDSMERIVVQNSIESANHVSDEKVLDVLSPQAANVEHQTSGGSNDLKTNEEVDGDDFGDILECDDKNEQSMQVSEDNLLSMNDSETKITSYHDLIEKECEVAAIIEAFKEDISKNKKIKSKKSKHKGEKTHHKAKSSKHKSLKSAEKKSKLKSLKANISRSPEVDTRYRSYRRDSHTVSRSRNASISRSRSRTREENRRESRQTGYSKHPRSPSYRRREESDDHDDRRDRRRSDKQRRNLKRVRNFLSLDSSVEEVFSNDEAYNQRERSSSRKSFSSKSDASSVKSIDNKKVHSRWSRSSGESEISQNSNLRWKVGLVGEKKPRHDSPDDDPERKFEFKKISSTEIKKRLRKTQEKDSSLVENKEKSVNSNGPKKKLSKVAIDLQDLISTEIISNLQQEHKNKKMNQANNDGLPNTDAHNRGVKKQAGIKKAGSKSKQNHAGNNSNFENADFDREKIPQTFETTQDLEVQSSTNFSHVVNKDQAADINKLGRAPLKISFKPRVVPKNMNTLVEASIKLSSSKFDMLFGERDAESECSPGNVKVGLWREVNSPEDGRSPLTMANKKAVSGKNKKLGGISLSKAEAEGGKEKGVTLNGKMKPKANTEKGSTRPSRDQYSKTRDEVESIRSSSSISRSVENRRRDGSRRRSRSRSRSSYSSMSRDRSWRGRRSRRRSYSYSSRSGRWSHRRSCSWSRSRSYSSRDSRRSCDRRWRHSSREDISRRYLDRRSRTPRRQKSYSSRSSSRTGVKRLRSYRDWSSFSGASRSRSRWSRSRSVSRRHSRRRKEESSRRHPSSASRTSESPSADSETGSKDENAAQEGHLMYECGDILQDRYEILSTLGTGTFSKVVDCVDLKSNSNVALKIVKNVQKYKEAAELEIGILKDIAVKDKHNENFCIQLHDTFDHLNHQCLVFDSLGLSLYEFLKSNSYQPYTMEQIKHIGYQLVKAVK